MRCVTRTRDEVDRFDYKRYGVYGVAGIGGYLDDGWQLSPCDRSDDGNAL